MPFRALQTKARNDLLGPGGLTQLAGNLRWVRDAAIAEHVASTGEHNAWQVPRRLVNISSAGVVSPSTSDVVSVAHPATGRYTISLATGRFSSNMRPQLNVSSKADIQAKPCIAGFSVLAANAIEVYIKKLSTALGAAGNVWADLDASFSIAFHAEPLPRGSYAADAVSRARGDKLTEVDTDWDASVQAHGDMYSMLTAAHTAAGAHNVFEVAKYWAHVNYKPTGTIYEAPEASSGTTLNRLAVGQVEVAPAVALNTPAATFVCPDYQRIYSGGTSDDVFVMNAEALSSKSTVYIYGYNATTNVWDVADADFFLAMHGS